MKIRPDWRGRLKAIVDGKELAPISRRAGLNPTYLRDTLKGRGTPSLENAEKLSGALGVSTAHWFIEAEIPVQAVSVGAGTTPSVQNFRQMPRDLPVFGSAQCGDNGAFEFNTGTAADYVRRPERLAGIKEAYALYVSGSSMSPWREEGQLVYVHPGQPPKIGDYVVIQIKTQEPGEAPRAYIKRLEKRTAKEIVVSQFNPPESRSWPTSKVHSVHRIVDWSELLSI